MLHRAEHEGLPGCRRSRARPGRESSRSSTRSPAGTACGFSGAALIRSRRWQDQDVTPDERYHGLIELLQETARRLVTFGLHVHVGVDSGDKAIMICDRILQHLPMLAGTLGQQPVLAGPEHRAALPAQQDHGDTADGRPAAADEELVGV